MEMPFSVQRIDHVVFRVRDLSRSIAFYQAVLGCAKMRPKLPAHSRSTHAPALVTRYLPDTVL